MIIQLKIKENSKEFQNLKRIQKITGIRDHEQSILGCINAIYERYYKKCWFDC